MSFIHAYTMDQEVEPASACDSASCLLVCTLMSSSVTCYILCSGSGETKLLIEQLPSQAQKQQLATQLAWYIAEAWNWHWHNAWVCTGRVCLNHLPVLFFRQGRVHIWGLVVQYKANMFRHFLFYQSPDAAPTDHGSPECSENVLEMIYDLA